MRLDASYYTQEAFLARKQIKELGYATKRVADFGAEIFNLSRFKRIWVDEEHGAPYLSPSDVFSFELPKERFIARNSVKRPERFFAKEGWILITCSGIVGQTTFVTKDLTEFFLSHDLIRIVPKNDQYGGYLLAYLSTWLGQAFLSKDQYGGVIKHIEPEHVVDISVPDLPESIQKIVHANIIKAYDMRQKARTLLKEAKKKLIEKCALRLEKSTEAQFFSVKYSDLDLRLNANYHEDGIQAVRRELRRKPFETKELRDVAKVYAPSTFKRVYVEKQFGLPLLQGRDITGYRPLWLQHIAKRIAEDPKNSLVIHKNWLLITGRGQVGKGIGKVALVSSHWNGWAASHNIWRIIPNEGTNAGYLAAYLLSDFGYRQLLSMACGMVVNVIVPQDTERVLLPIPPQEIQEEIGQLAIEAFTLKEKANFIEDSTVKTLEDLLSRHRKSSPKSASELEKYYETFELIGMDDFDEASLDTTILPYGDLKREIGL